MWWWAAWMCPGWAEAAWAVPRGAEPSLAVLPCSPQAPLCHRGVPGQVLALHAHRGGRAHLWNRGQAAGGCLLGNQDTHGAGKGLGCSSVCPPCRGRERGAFVPCWIYRNQNWRPMVEQGSKIVVEVWIMLFPVHWLFEC